MTARVIVPPKLLTEFRTDTIDFTPVFPPQPHVVSIVSLSTDVQVYSGTDPNPNALITANSVAGTLAFITYGPGVLGTIYSIRLDAVTTSPDSPTLSITYFLAVIPDLP